MKIKMKPETIERRRREHLESRVKNRASLVRRLQEMAERDRARGIPDDDNIWLLGLAEMDD